MKNFAAKTFLILTAVAVLSAATIARTVNNDGVVNYCTVAVGSESTSFAFGKSTNHDVINSFLNDEPTCYKMKVTKKGRKVYVEQETVPCPK